MRSVLIKIVYVAALSMVLSGGVHASCLPPQMKDMLQSRYPDSSIVELRDLDVGDQQILKNAHLDECPGVARGNFDGSGPSYAVTLFSQGTQKKQMLVLVRGGATKQRPKLQVIAGPVEVARLAIIRRLSPGTLESLEGRKVVAAYDALAYETLEAAVVVFYFSGGQFLDIQTDD